MGNCLVTKLKAEVPNENLKKLGELNLLIATNAGFAGICADVANLVNATLTGGTVNGETSFYVPSPMSNKAFVANQGATIIKMDIDNKYHITGLNDIWPKNIKELAYSPIVTFVTAALGARTNEALFESMENWDFSELENSIFAESIKTLNLNFNYGIRNSYWNKLIFPLDIIGKFTNLEVCKIMWTQVTGVFSDLGSCTKLTNVELSIGVSGTLESFVAKQRLSGKTTNSTGINLNISNANITFNGERVSADSVLTWTSNTITYNGVTINA